MTCSRFGGVFALLSVCALWASAETWDHWEFGSEVSGVWTKGATDAAGFGELRDGNWRLKAWARTADSTQIEIKASSAVPSTTSQTVILDGTGALDLSKPVRGLDDAALEIVALGNYALAYWNEKDAGSASPKRSITAFTSPKTLRSIGDYVLAGDSKIKAFVLDAPFCETIGSRFASEAGAYSATFTFSVPRCRTLGADTFYKSGFYPKLSPNTFSLDGLECMGVETFYGTYGRTSGTLRMPSIKAVERQQFYQSTAISGLIFGSDDPRIAQLERIGISDTESFTPWRYDSCSVFGDNGCPTAEYLVIGGGANAMLGRLAFDRTAGEYGTDVATLPKRIYFTGAKPAIRFGAFYNKMERSPKTSAFIIRRGQPGWDAIVAAAVGNATEDDKTNFDTEFAGMGLTFVGVIPTDPSYSGITDVATYVKTVPPVTDSVYFGNSAPQYVAYGNFRTVNNDVEVRNVMPDGSYLVSDELLGFWTEKELAVGAVRTISVPEEVVAADGGTYVCDGYTLETAEEDGWSQPGALVAATSYVHTQSAAGSVRVSFKWSLAAGVPNPGIVWKVADPLWQETTGDAVVRTYSKEPDEAGRFPADTKIVLTPTWTAWQESDGLPKWGFSHWEGNLADCTVDENTGVLEIPIDAASRTLVARFRHDWLWSQNDSGNEGVLSNRQFALRASLRPAASGELFLGDGRTYGHAFVKTMGDNDAHPEELYPMANRPLDLAQPITDATGKPFALTEIKSWALGTWTSYKQSRSGSVNDPRLADYPSEIVLPKTLKTLGADAIRTRYGFDSTPLVGLVFDCPDLTGTLPNRVGYGHYYIRNVVLRLPKVTAMGTQLFGGAGSYGKLSETDFSQWNLESLEALSGSEFYLAGTGNANGMSGTLVLPSVRSVGAGAFSTLGKMTGVVLGDRRRTLESIGANAFQNCASLASVTIGAKTLTVDPTAFAGTTALKEIRMIGEPLGMPAVDAILSETVAGYPGGYARLYVDRSNGWDGLFDALDAEAGETCPPDVPAGDLLGVWRDGSRKAYAVAWDSPWKHRGLLLIFR